MAPTATCMPCAAGVATATPRCKRRRRYPLLLLLSLLPFASTHTNGLTHPHTYTTDRPHPGHATCLLRQLFPLGGPFTGNTAVTVTGTAFQDLGDVKCRFGIDEVQARVLNSTTIECSSPGCASPDRVRARPSLSPPKGFFEIFNMRFSVRQSNSVVALGEAVQELCASSRESKESLLCTAYSSFAWSRVGGFGYE